MKLRISILIVLALSLSACVELGAHALPEKFKNELTSLRSSNIEIDRKVADLQKQIVDLETQKQWNCARENSVANEALNSLNLSWAEYNVNIDTLEIQSKKTR